MSLVSEFGNGSSLTLKRVVNGEPQEVKLQLGKLNLTAMAKFAEWAQDVVIARSRKLAASLPEEARRFAIMQGVDIVTKQSDWGGPVCDALFRSPLGLAKMISIVIEPTSEYKNLKPEDIADMITPEQGEEISRALFRSAGVSDEQAKKLIEQSKRPQEAETPPQSTGVS